MNLVLIRRRFTDRSTIGELCLEGEQTRECYTLEDRVRQGPKIPGKTAIPAGRYQVLITHSARFKQPLPLLVNVPGFEGIRIHPGNTAADTAGCILVGRERGEDCVRKSRLAFAPLFAMIQRALDHGSVWLTILERPEHEQA